MAVLAHPPSRLLSALMAVRAASREWNLPREGRVSRACGGEEGSRGGGTGLVAMGVGFVGELALLGPPLLTLLLQ